jgi:hypothetical protein
MVGEVDLLVEAGELVVVWVRRVAERDVLARLQRRPVDPEADVARRGEQAREPRLLPVLPVVLREPGPQHPVGRDVDALGEVEAHRQLLVRA